MTANCEIMTRSLMDKYEKLWPAISGSQTDGQISQTDIFLKYIPSGECDFTDTFKELGLDKIFTSPRLSTKMLGPWNCNHLFRSSQSVCDIVVYSTEKYTVLQPMGEPGLALGNHGTKISHLMIVTSGSGPITFNELLASTPRESEDLQVRIHVMKQAVLNIRNNVPLGQCGDKVSSKARSMTPPCPLTMGIREFMAHQISAIGPEKRQQQPGYILKNSEDVDISSDSEAVGREIDDVFSNMSLYPFLCIQPPNKNTQLLSHIHCFLLPEGPLPSALDENYVNVELISLLKSRRHLVKHNFHKPQVLTSAPDLSSLAELSTISVPIRDPAATRNDDIQYSKSL